MEHRNTVLGIALCTVALGSAAMSMGPSRGSAVIGQPLELSFDVGLDPGMDAASACAQAELYYGDTRIDSSRFRISTTAGSTPQQAVVRLVSNVAVNEPVVSVVLRAGCGQTLSRRYVLLSSSPEMAAGRAVEAAVPFARTAPPSGYDAPALSGQSASASRSSSMLRRQQNPTEPSSVGDLADGVRTRPTAPAAEARRAPAPPPRRVTGTPSAPPPRPRLELQSPSEWLEDLQLPLRYSNTLTAPTAASPEQRAAAAALWRNLNGEAPPVAGTSDMQQRAQTLEQQNKTLRESLAKTRLREAELQAQLETAQREGDWIRALAWPGAVGVVALLALMGAMAAVRRTGRPAVWWKPRNERRPDGSDSAGVMDDPEFVDTQPSIFGPLPTSESTVPLRPEAANPVVARDAEEQADVVEHIPELDARSSAIAFTDGDSVMPARAPTAIAEAREDVPASTRSVISVARELRDSSANALVQVRQNAEFFISLGQYEEAIDALQTYISKHPGVSPEAYLDLFQIFHTLSLTDAYRRLREQFNAAFNANIPVFAGFLRPTRVLESYEPVMERLVAVWGTAAVLDFIEELMFARPASETNDAAVFELEAFRELMMLYEIAKSTLTDDASRRDMGVPLVAHAAVDPIEFSLDDRPGAEVVSPEPAVLDVDYQPKFPLSDHPFELQRDSARQTSTSNEKELSTDFDFSTLELAGTSTAEASQQSAAFPASEQASKHSNLFDTAEVTHDRTTDRAEPSKDKPQSNLIDFDAFDLDVPEARPPRKP